MIKKIKIRKKVQFGIEFELFTLDKDGYMVSGAERLIKRVQKEHPEIEMKPECAKNMIEIITSPHTEVPDVMLKTIADFESVVMCAKKEDLILYAYGTYPGSFTPEIYPAKRYETQKKILGKQKFLISGRCIGLHIHYSLPWGVFDTINKVIKPLTISKNKQSMINVYNLCIAMDPALSTFAQSSPFYQGKRLGKDARAIMYRGGKELDSPDGLYANLPQFGSLLGYMSTNTDLLNLIKERFTEWEIMLKQVGSSVKMFAKYGSILDSTWNPVKVNAHGTMEIRGMDINHPDVVVAIAIIVKFIIKAIQEKFLNVIPSDVGVSEPFKREGKNIYIPPDSHVRNVLQKKAVYAGLEDDAILIYCTNLIKLAKQFVPEQRWPLLKPLEEMIKNRTTASDRVIALARQLGIDTEKELNERDAALLAKNLSNDLYTEFTLTKENLIKYLADN